MKRYGRRLTKLASALRLEILEQKHLLAADFLSFSVVDASGDDSPAVAFESGALAVNYTFDADGQSLESIDLFTRKGDRTLKVGEYNALAASGRVVSLDGFSGLAGSHDLFAVASLAGGGTVTSPSVPLEVLGASSYYGDLSAETFAYAGSAGTASVYYGGGGTDTLSLNANPSFVTGFNGSPLGGLTPNGLIASQAIYAGTSFDYLQLSDGSQIYLHGIERLSFNNGTVTQLQTRPNDPGYEDQWNMTIADVPDAWRFTRGSDDVLLVSIDTGIPISNGVPQHADLTDNRLTFLGAASGSDHGHRAVSVMSATPNNNEGIAGINWGSPVLVLDVYGGDAGNIGINTAINTAVSHLGTIPASRIVFQGGIQGEYWLDVLEGDKIPSLAENGLFAMAAGNGGQDISIASHPDGLSAGIARLEGEHDNVIATGALFQNGPLEWVDGLENSTGVRLASYSNFGENLTFAAPTSTPAVFPDGGLGSFGGTSGANPVMAGYSSLVWSVNPALTAGEVRQILAETVTDVGAPGRDPTFGHGVPNAGAAVRRAWAMAENSELAALAENPFSAEPELPGDYNGDNVVNAADYTVWRDTLGSPSVQFAGADGDGSTVIGQADFQVWRSNYGSEIALVTTPLIDATTGNGEFAVDSANDAASIGGGTEPLTTDISRDRALRGTSGVGRGVAIDGWEITRVGYEGANPAIGVDGGYGLETNAGTDPGQTGQAFVNSGVIDVRSDTIVRDFSVDDVIDLSYLLGSDTAGGTRTVSATVSLILDAGLPTETVQQFNTRSATGLGTPPITEQYTLLADASTASLLFRLDGGQSGTRALLDEVNLSVTALMATGGAAASQSLSTASSHAATTGHDAIDSVFDQMPAVASASNQPIAPSAPSPSVSQAAPAPFRSTSVVERPIDSALADSALLLLQLRNAEGDRGAEAETIAALSEGDASHEVDDALESLALGRSGFGGAF